MTAKALRQSVLQRAIQGKLVPQDPSDEPASVLLEKIKEEKKAANDKSYVDSCIYKGADEKFYEKVGKAEKDITDEIPFDIPDSWEWTRISTYTQKVTDYVASGSFASLRENVKYYKTENYALLVKTQDFSNGFTKNLTYTDEHGYNFLNNSNLFGGELILSNVGSIGKVFIVPELNRPATLAPNAIMVRCYDPKQVPWLYNVFLSDFGKKSLLKISSATAIAKFNKTGFKTLLVPIPPIAEQQKIVEALDKIYPLLDEYEKLEEETSRLDGEICDKLRNSILQYAMQGKLVPQDSSDEPASVLLEKITREGQKKLGKGYVTSRIYKGTDDKTYEKIGEKVGDLTNEVPFDIPDTWSWVRLRDIAELNPRNKVNDNLDAGFIPMASLVGGYRSEYSYEVKKWKSIKNGFTHFSEGDVIVAKITPCLQNRKSAIIHSLPNGIGAGTTELHVVRPLYDDMCREYLLWIFKSSYFIDSAAKSVSGTAGQQRVGKEFMSKFLIPLPPLAEQQRIAKALDKAFAEIDALETAIKNSDLA